MNRGCRNKDGKDGRLFGVSFTPIGQPSEGSCEGPECSTVILARLLSEAEQRKEQERAERIDPSVEFDGD